MNYLLIMMSLCLTAYHLCAQSLERFVIGSAGLSNQNENIQLSFTVGETVVSTFHTDDFLLTQGFQQTSIEEIPTGIELPAYIHDIIAFPNPLGTTLYLEIKAAKVAEFSLEVYDLNGKRQTLPALLLGSTGHAQYQMDVADWVPGMYLLMIKTIEGVPVKVFKIQKM